MEPLSGAASGMAVVSLALQLIQSVSSINAFIQAVKGAPTEITRLTSSLDRLHALLQDVCQLMELQTSRSGEHIPRPSMTIFSCLTSCQQHLLPLQDIVKSNEESQGQNHSKSLRLWSSIKLGFKTSDIMAFEARIHQEMVNLTTALMLNSTSIQLHALPMILHSQHVMSISSASSSQQHHIPTGKEFDIVPTTQHYASHDIPPSALVRQRVIRMPSYFERFGFKRQKIQRTLRTTQVGRYGSKKSDQEIFLQEENIHSWAAVWIGYGIRCSRVRPYGSILPSLTTYPVVSFYSSEIHTLINNGTVFEIQKAFYTGVVHPFTRNASGQTLLHIAAVANRIDICQLLVKVGVLAGDTGYPGSLFEIAIYNSWGDLMSVIDTCRFLLENTRLENHFTVLSSIYQHSIPRPSFVLRVYEWLWEAGSAYLCEEETAIMKSICKCTALTALHEPLLRHSAAAFLRKIMGASIIQHHGPGQHNWLECLFDIKTSNSQLDSFEVGKTFVDILVNISADIKTFIEQTLELYPPSSWNNYEFAERQIIFNYTDERGWILGWNWVYDAQDPGFLVASEFSTMATEASWYDAWLKWPFVPKSIDWYDDENLRKREEKVYRRMALKAQKEFKRNNKGKPRSKMPGSWTN